MSLMENEVIKELDLHRMKHEDVDRLVENFVLLNEPPMKIITGNSEKRWVLNSHHGVTSAVGSNVFAAA